MITTWVGFSLKAEAEPRAKLGTLTEQSTNTKVTTVCTQNKVGTPKLPSQPHGTYQLSMILLHNEHLQPLLLQATAYRMDNSCCPLLPNIPASLFNSNVIN
jgi:hypothetical protein